MNNRHRHIIYQREWPKEGKGCLECGCDFKGSCGHDPIVECRKDVSGSCYCCNNIRNIERDEVIEAYMEYDKEKGQLRLF